MRYPLNRFKEDWYSAQGFGAKTTYGYHEAEDLNLKTGADSDLGQPILAISKGKLEYYHKASHATNGFGYHSVYRIDGPWGTRYVHQAHMLDDLATGVQELTEGQQVGRVGKSGTTYAHLHFAIFKVDPSTLPNGIDTIAKTKQQLNDWWEAPLDFIDRWSQVPSEKMVTIPQKEVDELRDARDKNWNLYQDEVKKKENVILDLSKTESNLNSCLTMVEKITQEDKDTTQQLIDAQKALTPYQEAISQIRLVLGLSEDTTLSDLVDKVEEVKNSKVKFRDITELSFIERLIILFGKR